MCYRQYFWQHRLFQHQLCRLISGKPQKLSMFILHIRNLNSQVSNIYPNRRRCSIQLSLSRSCNRIYLLPNNSHLLHNNQHRAQLKHQHLLNIHMLSLGHEILLNTCKFQWRLGVNMVSCIQYRFPWRFRIPYSQGLNSRKSCTPEDRLQNKIYTRRECTLHRL